jgi:hypothetical protein
LGCEAAPKSKNAVYQVHRAQGFYDCFAAERG